MLYPGGEPADRSWHRVASGGTERSPPCASGGRRAAGVVAEGGRTEGRRSTNGKRRARERWPGAWGVASGCVGE